MAQTRMLDDQRVIEDAICVAIRKLLPDAPVYFYWTEGKINLYVFALSSQGHVCRGTYVLSTAWLSNELRELEQAARSIFGQLEIVCGDKPQTITLSLAKAVEHGSPQE